MLSLIDSFPNRVSADKYHMTDVNLSSSRVFLKFSAYQLLAVN